MPRRNATLRRLEREDLLAAYSQRPGLQTVLQLESHCCGKRSYATQETAQRDLDRIRATSRQPTLPQRVYYCEAGWFHLTSTLEYSGTDSRVRGVVLSRDRFRCVRCGSSVYGSLASVHHRRWTGMGSKGVNSPANLLTLCSVADGTPGCLGWVRTEPAAAAAVGLAVPLDAAIDPADVPVDHFVHGRVLLLADGGWTPVPLPTLESS
jgi:hypothetical protein